MQFNPGKYKTREGGEAVVHFEVSEPTDTKYRLQGEAYREGKWHAVSWTHEGRLYSDDECSADLMPPVTYLYATVFCDGNLSSWWKRADNEGIGVLRVEVDEAGRLVPGTLCLFDAKALEETANAV
jgi:hypothetical protein